MTGVQTCALPICWNRRAQRDPTPAADPELELEEEVWEPDAPFDPPPEPEPPRADDGEEQVGDVARVEHERRHGEVVEEGAVVAEVFVVLTSGSAEPWKMLSAIIFSLPYAAWFSKSQEVT